jgi:hypothetical protein
VYLPAFAGDTPALPSTDLLGLARADTRGILRVGQAGRDAKLDEDDEEQNLAASGPHLWFPTHRQDVLPSCTQR